MESINRLREYVENASRMSISLMARATLLGMVRDIEQEVGNMVPLPVDADGVPIHVGERVQLIGNDPSTVSHMSLAGDGWRVYVKYDGDLGTGSGEPSRIRHHHAPTVEDVLREFAHVGIRIAAKHGITAGEIDFYADEEAIAEYAAKLRLAEDNDGLYEWERDE